MNSLVSVPALEELNLTLVLFRLLAAAKRAKISAPAGLRIHLARIQPVLPRL
jgi:hypothetical protein